MRPAPLHPLALALLAGAALLGTAGCGSDDATGAGASSPADITAAASSATDPATASGEDATAYGDAESTSGTPNTDDEQAPTRKGQGDYSAPAAASAKTADTVPAATGLELDSPKGGDLEYTVQGKKDGTEFCVHREVPAANPDPDCNNGTVLALQFFSDEATGHALGTVDFAPVDKRSPPTELLVSGVAAGDVREVDVNYAQHTYKAALSTQSAQLPVDKSLARELSGATKRQQALLPSRVTVRIFAVSMSRISGNPPAVATPRTVRPVNGKVTFDLN